MASYRLQLSTVVHMWSVECGMWNAECGMWNVLFHFRTVYLATVPTISFPPAAPCCVPQASASSSLAFTPQPALLQYIINMYSSRGARVCAHTRIHARLTSSSFAIIVFYFYFFFPPSFFLFFFFFSSSRSFKVHSSQFSSHFFATFFFLVKRVFFLLIFSPHYRLSHFFPFPCSEPPTLAVALTGCDVM